MALLTYGVGACRGPHQAKRAPQGWEFYAATACLFVTLGFPGWLSGAICAGTPCRVLTTTCIERCQRSDTVFEGNFLHVQRDQVALPDGRSRHANSSATQAPSAIVPLLDDGRLLMERQYRHPMGRVMLEFPAGKLDAGEPPFAVCRAWLEERPAIAHANGRMPVCSTTPSPIPTKASSRSTSRAGFNPGASTWTMASSSNSRSSRCQARRDVCRRSGHGCQDLDRTALATRWQRASGC